MSQGLLAGQPAQGADALAGPTLWGAGPAGGRGASGERRGDRVSPDRAGSEGGRRTQRGGQAWHRHSAFPCVPATQSPLCPSVILPPTTEDSFLGGFLQVPRKASPISQGGDSRLVSPSESGQEAGARWRRWVRRRPPLVTKYHKPGDGKRQKCVVSQFRKSEPRILAGPVPPEAVGEEGPRPPPGPEVAVFSPCLLSLPCRRALDSPPVVRMPVVLGEVPTLISGSSTCLI